MRISGYGEFQQLRRLSQKDKDEAQLKEKETLERAEPTGTAGDSVLISPETRRKAKLSQALDFRQEKVAGVRSKMEDGSLTNPEALRSGTRKMLDSLFQGYL
jgi:anti-sigma28 factor (negative regulator of flagellin synthesis)